MNVFNWLKHQGRLAKEQKARIRQRAERAEAEEFLKVVDGYVGQPVESFDYDGETFTVCFQTPGIPPLTFPPDILIDAKEQARVRLGVVCPVCVTFALNYKCDKCGHEWTYQTAAQTAEAEAERLAALAILDQYERNFKQREIQ